jgi:hypothetical protein
MTLSKLLYTQSLANGDYELTVRIHDRVSGQGLTPSAKFSVVQ